MFMGLPNCFEICKWFWACPKLKPLPQLNKLIKRFNKINKNVGVNRAPVLIRQSGRAGNSGRDTFEKENLIKCKTKELNRRPGVLVRIHLPGRVGLGGRHTSYLQCSANILHTTCNLNSETR